MKMFAKQIVEDLEKFVSFLLSRSDLNLEPVFVKVNKIQCLPVRLSDGFNCGIHAINNIQRYMLSLCRNIHSTPAMRSLESLRSLNLK